MARQRTDDGGEGKRGDTVGRILAYAPDLAVMRWIEHELFGEAMTMSTVASIADVAAALTVAGEMNPRILVVQMGAVSPTEIADLHRMRRSWSGTLIALGHVKTDLQISLKIDRVLAPPFGSEMLRRAVTQIEAERVDRPTTRIRKLEPR